MLQLYFERWKMRFAWVSLQVKLWKVSLSLLCYIQIQHILQHLEQWPFGQFTSSLDLPQNTVHSGQAYIIFCTSLGIYPFYEYDFHSCNLVFMPFKLPNSIQDIYKLAYDSLANAKVLTFLKCKLVHAIWSLLLINDFVDAYVFGIIVLCTNGVSRWLFPWFFTYSADYPEKYNHPVLYSISANKFWTELFSLPSNSLDIACVHFVRVL